MEDWWNIRARGPTRSAELTAEALRGIDGLSSYFVTDSQDSVDTYVGLLLWVERKMIWKHSKE